jgi:hypothetical protein
MKKSLALLIPFVAALGCASSSPASGGAGSGGSHSDASVGTGGDSTGTGGATAGTGGTTGAGTGGVTAGGSGGDDTAGTGGIPAGGSGGDSTGTGGVTAGGAGGDSTAGTGGAPGPGATTCPATAPASGACGIEGLFCSYGTAPRPECRTQVTCSAGNWSADPPNCPTSLATGCPTPAPTVGGASVTCDATLVSDYCLYTATQEECTCVGGAQGGVWVCNQPTPPAAPCPATLPNAGTACTGEIGCNYPCAGQLYAHKVMATCTGGTWQWAISGCIGGT